MPVTRSRGFSGPAEASRVRTRTEPSHPRSDSSYRPQQGDIAEEGSDSYEVVGSHLSPETVESSTSSRNAGPTTMANQGPQGGQQPDLGNPAPYVVMEDLPIVVPVNLPLMPMYPHFQMFEGHSHQDPQKHVRDFANTCVSNQVADDRYLLIWFPTTLRGKAANWYWSNPARTFATWVALRDAFLQRYRAVIDQRGALLALSSLQQDQGETVSEFVARFQLVRQRCANNLLEDATILGFFLEGLSESILREVVVHNPLTVDDAVAQALAAERVDQMVNKIRLRQISIPGYLPVNRVPVVHDPPEPRSALGLERLNRPDSPPGGHLMVDHRDIAFPMPMRSVPIPQVKVPEPLPLPPPPSQLEFRNEILSAIDRRFETFSEQMSCLVGDQTRQAPPTAEQGPGGTGIWCRGCRQLGHTEQNCPRTQPPGPPRGRERPDYERPRPQAGRCPRCNKSHPGECWEHLVCSNCGGRHPSDRCRNPDKRITRDYPRPPVGQVEANHQGQRFPYDPRPAELPPQHALYYSQPTAIMPRPTLPAAPQSSLLPNPYHPQGDVGPPVVRPSQDHRVDPHRASTSKDPALAANLVEVFRDSRPLLPLPLPRPEGYADALAVQTRHQRLAQRTAPGYETPMPQESSPSPRSPHLSELNEVMAGTKRDLEMAQQAASRVEKGKAIAVGGGPDILEQPIDLGDPEYAHVRMGAARVPRKTRLPAFEKDATLSYKLWEDLNTVRANISLAQLLEVAPSVKRALRSGMSRRRQSRPAMFVEKLRHRVDPGPIKVEVQIADHYVPHCLVDGGSGVNIMPKFTVHKLGLHSSGPSHVSMGLANQTRITPIGQILGVRVLIGEEVYMLDFQILDIPDDGRSYPLLLGRPWLHKAKAIIDWGLGTISFGHKPVRSKVSKPKIERRRAEHELPPIEEEDEWTSSESFESEDNCILGDEAYVLSPRKPKTILPPLEISMHKVTNTIGPVMPMGPGLYGWDDDKEFVDWLKEHPNSEDDSMMIDVMPCEVMGDKSELEERDLPILKGISAVGAGDTTLVDAPLFSDSSQPLILPRSFSSIWDFYRGILFTLLVLLLSMVFRPVQFLVSLARQLPLPSDYYLLSLPYGHRRDDLSEWDDTEVFDESKVEPKNPAPNRSTCRQSSQRIRHLRRCSGSRTRSESRSIIARQVIEERITLVGQVLKRQRATKICYTTYDNLRMGPYVILQKYPKDKRGFNVGCHEGAIKVTVERCKDYRV